MGNIIEAYYRFVSEEGVLFRYSLAFSIFMAIFPTIIVVIVAFSITFSSYAEMMQALYQLLPEDMVAPLVDYVSETDYGSGFSLIVTLVASLFLASRSFYSFMLIAKVDESFIAPNYLIRLKAFFMYAFTIVIIDAITLVNVFHFLPGGLLNFVFFLGAFYLMFRTFSFKKQPWTYGLIGAATTSVLVIGIGWIFFNLADYTTRYESLYGPLSSILLGLLSVYFIATAIYAGYIINSTFSREFDTTEYKTLWFYAYGMYFSGMATSFGKMVRDQFIKKISTK